MNNYMRQFKGDIFDGTIDLIKAIWKPVFMAYIIFYVLTRLLSLGMMSLFGMDKILEMSNNIQEWILDPEKSAEYSAFLMEKLQQPEIVAAFILAVAFGILVVGWSYNFVYRIVEEEIKGNAIDVKKELSWSFNNKIYGIIGIAILWMMLSWMAITIGVGLSAAISPFLLVVTVPLIFYYIFRMILVLPAYVLGDMSIPAAFKFSYDHLTVNRVIKVIGIGLAFIAGLILISMVLQIIASLFSGIPGATYIVSSIVGYFTNALMITVVVASFSALYYRYADVEAVQNDMDMEDDLIDL